MADGKCENCGKKIDSKYKYCLGCMNDYKKDNSTETPAGDSSDICEKLERIDQTLQRMNWNFGMLVATIRKDKELVEKLVENEK